MRIKLEGVFVPVVTPFDPETQALRLDMLERNIERLNTTGMAAYMPLGSNGEFKSLTEDEGVSVIKVVVDAAQGMRPVFAGAGCESSYATLKSIEKYAAVGANAVFLLTPHYFAGKMTDEALGAYFLEVANNSALPVLLYSAPLFASGVSISPDCARILATHDNIIGMKDTSTSDIGIYTDISREHPNFSVLAGTFGSFLSGLRKGATGGVLSSSNYMPELLCSLYQLHMHSMHDEADALNSALNELFAAAGNKFGVAGVKAAMNIRGYSGGVPRLPLAAVSHDNIIEMIKAFEMRLASIQKLAFLANS